MKIYKKISLPIVLSFDLDDTLYDNSFIVENAENQVFQLFSSYLNNVCFSDILYQKIKQNILNNNLEIESDVSLLRFFIFQNILIMDGYSTSESNMISEKLINEFINLRSRINVSHETISVLQKLQEKYKLVCISNGNMDVSKTILRDVFCRNYYSNINNLGKPNPYIFQKVISDFNIKNYDLCHVGDNGYTDILGACRFGASTIMTTQYIKNTKLQILPNIEISSIKELLKIL